MTFAYKIYLVLLKIKKSCVKFKYDKGGIHGGNDELYAI